jgi:dTDP-glucose 4,6-dehydratase
MIVSEDIASIIKRIGNKLDSLAGQNIFITGATGFVGSYLLETAAAINDRILPKPCHVIILTRDRSAFASKMQHVAARKDLTILTGDIHSYNIESIACDYIIHAAAPSDPYLVKTDPLSLMETISRGTLNVLELAARNKVKSILFISSGAVYGTQPPDLKQLPEDFLQGPDLHRPESGYGEGKRYAEILCTIYREKYSFPLKIARLFTFIGPYLNLNAGFAASEFIRKCLLKEPITIKGDGTPLRSYCYSADLAVALWSILLSESSTDVFNVGSDEEISISELAKLIASNFDHKTEIIIDHSLSRTGKLPHRYIPDISRLKKDLEFHLKYPVAVAVRRTINWLRSNSL